MPSKKKIIAIQADPLSSINIKTDTTFLLALGYSKQDIANEFYKKELFSYDKDLKKWKTKFDPDNYKTIHYTSSSPTARQSKWKKSPGNYERTPWQIRDAAHRSRNRNKPPEFF